MSTSMTFSSRGRAPRHPRTRSLPVGGGRDKTEEREVCVSPPLYLLPGTRDQHTWAAQRRWHGPCHSGCALTEECRRTEILPGDGDLLWQVSTRPSYHTSTVIPAAAETYLLAMSISACQGLPPLRQRSHPFR